MLKQRNELDEIATRLQELGILVRVEASKRRVMETQLNEFNEGKNMDLGKMSMEEHVRNNPQPYDFFNKEDFNLGRFLGRVEAKILLLKKKVQLARSEIPDEKPYTLMETVYEDLSDIQMEFEDL